MRLVFFIWNHTQQYIHSWVKIIIEKKYEDITFSKAKNNSIKSDKYPTFNDIQINNIKTFTNRINNPPWILNNNFEKKIGNNIISKSQPPIISNIDTIHTHNDINNSQLSNINNHQDILTIQNPVIFILNSDLNYKHDSSPSPSKNKLNNPIIIKFK